MDTHIENYLVQQKKLARVLNENYLNQNALDNLIVIANLSLVSSRAKAGEPTLTQWVNFGERINIGTEIYSAQTPTIARLVAKGYLESEDSRVVGKSKDKRKVAARLTDKGVALYSKVEKILQSN